MGLVLMLTLAEQHLAIHANDRHGRIIAGSFYRQNKLGNDSPPLQMAKAGRGYASFVGLRILASYFLKEGLGLAIHSHGLEG